jgi:hypothetical protein
MNQKNQEGAPTKQEFYVVDPPDATPGTLGVLVPTNRAKEMGELEQERQVRVWPGLNPSVSRFEPE